MQDAVSLAESLDDKFDMCFPLSALISFPHPAVASESEAQDFDSFQVKWFVLYVILCHPATATTPSALYDYTSFKPGSTAVTLTADEKFVLANMQSSFKYTLEKL